MNNIKGDDIWCNEWLIVICPIVAMFGATITAMCNGYLCISRLANNPTTKAVDNKTDLQLALNTAQVGRTFQDRSHVIILKPRTFMQPEHRNRTVRYIGGIGKRGNIVQTYPAMEYRFFPERITVTTEEIVCFVWSGMKENL